MPLGLQSKLLRFLEQGEVQRLGSTDTFRVDVRVVAATNSNLRQLVQESLPRRPLLPAVDLSHELPPLRERMDDLLILASTFLPKFCPGTSVSARKLLPSAAAHLAGKRARIRNVMERASILLGQAREIRPEHIVI